MKKKNKHKNSTPVLKGVLLLMVALVTSGSVYAWTSYTDWKKNHLETTFEKNPSIVIKGDTEPAVLMLQHSKNKNIKVRNEGEIPVFIRLSMKEHLALFKMDMVDKKGNGNIKEYTELGEKSELLLHDIATWKVGSRLMTPEKNYHEVDKIMEADVKEASKGRPKEMMDIALELNLSTSTEKGYWLYEENTKDNKGYYFFTLPILPEEETDILIENVTLLGSAPNSYKGSLHQFEVEADAGVVDVGVFSDWDIDQEKNSTLYRLYSEAIDNKGTEVVVK